MQVINSSDEIKIVIEWNQYRGLDLEMVKTLMKGISLLIQEIFLTLQRPRILGLLSKASAESKSFFTNTKSGSSRKIVLVILFGSY